MRCNNCNSKIDISAICPCCGAKLLKDPLPHHLPAGVVIGGRYTIAGVIGEGGFGITYLGKDEKLGHAVAVKEFFPHGFSFRNSAGSYEVYVTAKNTDYFFEHGKERFLSEARTLAKFNGEPGVVSVTDFVEENNTAYLVMEYLSGVTLQQYLKSCGRLSTEETLGMLEPMMATLDKIHQAGIIHRDISPDNIMRLYNGQLKLMDFGAAREYINDERSMSVMLKQGYAPIEQYKRSGRQGPWTDVYAMCATVYRCITGKTPDSALDRLPNDELLRPSQLGADISPAAENVLMYGLAVYGENRCQSMTELLFLLKEAAGAPADDYVTVRLDDDRTVVADGDIQYGFDTQRAQTEDPAYDRAPLHDVRMQDGGAPDRSADADAYRQSKPKKRGALIGLLCGLAVLLIAAAVIVITALVPAPDKGTDTDIQSVGSDDAGTVENHAENTLLSAGSHHTVGLKSDGTVVAAGINKYGQCDVGGWTDIISVSGGYYHTVGLKSDGTVVATAVINGGDDLGQYNVGDWTDIVAVDAGSAFTVGIKSDGTAVAVGENLCGQCDVGDWTDVVAVSAGDAHAVGLRRDGTVVASGTNREGQCNVGDWTDIVAVSAGFDHTVGVKSDGTVVVTGKNTDGRCDVGGWTDIVAVDAGTYHTVGLKRDGTVVSTTIKAPDNDYGQTDVGSWNDIIAISSDYYHTVGLKSDGTVVATQILNNEYNDRGQSEVGDWDLK